MTFQEELNEFIDNLYCNAANDEYKKSQFKYEHWNKKQDQIDEFLNTQLTAEQKSFVDDVLFELLQMADHKARAVYWQGYQDCTALLKSIGAL